MNKWVRRFKWPHILCIRYRFYFCQDIHVKCEKCENNWVWNAKITNFYIWLFPVGAFIFGSECSRHHSAPWENHTKCSASDPGGWCDYFTSSYHGRWMSRIHIIILWSKWLLPSRWSGCGTPPSSRLPVHWVSEKTWSAVSICSCVERSPSSIPETWLWVYAHLGRWLAASSSRETVRVSAATMLLALL